ncbi:hypothetical protein [Nitrososphaera sp.]|uniref:hypothetical protein n=1 Tax=Nitrososphaera sp. TaxID=1971748 RepID=UPI002ED7CBAB
MVEKLFVSKLQNPLLTFAAVILTSAALVPVIAGNMMYAEAAPAVEICAFGTNNIVNGLTVHSGEKCTVDGYTLTNTAVFLIEASGTLKISETGTFDNAGGILSNSGSIRNEGTLYNGGGGAQIINQAAGTIQNEGSIWNGFITFGQDTIANFGTIKNKGIIYNGIVGNAIINFGTGTILNTGTIDNDAFFENLGLIKSRGTIENDGGGVFINSTTGVIENGGLIENDVSAIFNNLGTINNQGSIINCGSFSNTGTINGNPVEADCTG